MSLPARREAHDGFPVKACYNLGLKVERHIECIDGIDEPKEHKAKEKALEMMAGFEMSEADAAPYRSAFARWEKAVTAAGDCENFEISSRSRVLLGTGNASVFEFGFNLNYPWGVPYIPGSSLKGLLSSYLSRHDSNWKRDKTNPAVKSDFQVELFGGIRENGDESYSGILRFNDAWLLPARTHWFEPDIINQHYKSYYRGEKAPDGTENPFPDKIAAFRPRLTFLVCIQGKKDCREFAKKHLLQALDEEGIGGKTAVGYGRFVDRKKLYGDGGKSSSGISDKQLKLNPHAGEQTLRQNGSKTSTNKRNQPKHKLNPALKAAIRQRWS